MCAHCHMAISQPQFAAETLDRDTNVTKFDDIGCMLKSLGAGKPAAIFVADYNTRQWFDVRDAYFVRTSKMQTPMGGGILAFGDRAAAEKATRDYGQAPVLRFAQLTAH